MRAAGYRCYLYLHATAKLNDIDREACLTDFLALRSAFSHPAREEASSSDQEKVKG